MCSKPRVIAAEIKKDFSKDVLHGNTGSKPHIAGELELVGCTSSEPHWVEVRDGQLVVYPGVSPSCPPVWRLSLRRLNLHPASTGRPRGFSLTRHGELTPIATFQVANDLEYSRWVRTLAAELLKQTPLDAVKFLDILGITATLVSESREPRRSLSPEYHSEPESRSWSYSPVARLTPEPPRHTTVHTVPRNWYHKPLELAQPLSLVITEEPKKNSRKTLSCESSPEDSVDGRLHVVDTICNLASRNCFSSCDSSKEEKHPHPPPRENRVRSLLKAFQTAQKIAKETPSTSPPHCIDMKDDGRMGRPPLPDVIRDLPPCERRSRARTRTPTPLRLRGKSLDILPSTEDCQVAELIARCQQEDRYVPVRDKTLLFESLGRTSSQPCFVHSSDNLTNLHDASLSPQPPRTQSLHDLSGSNVAVKEICRYFEQRGGSRGELTTRSPSPDCRLRITAGCKPLDVRSRQTLRSERRLCRLKQNIAESEQTIWRLQDQRDKLSLNTRGSSVRIQKVVDDRLEEERDRLKKLQEERFLVQQELEASPDPFGITPTKVRHHSNVR